MHIVAAAHSNTLPKVDKEGDAGHSIPVRCIRKCAWLLVGRLLLINRHTPAAQLCWHLARGCHHGIVRETTAMHHFKVHEAIAPQQFPHVGIMA